MSIDDILVRNPNRPNIGIMIVHMHDYFLDKISQPERRNIINNQREILRYAAQYDIPVAAVHYSGYGPLTEELKPAFNLVPRKWNITTASQNPFSDTNIDIIYKANNVNALLIMGVLTSACVASAANAAHNKQYAILLSQDLTADEQTNEPTKILFQADQLHRLSSISNSVPKYTDILQLLKSRTNDHD